MKLRIPGIPVFWIVLLGSFAVYAITCARHLSWQHDGSDGGDLALCAYTLGIPHPTGYPLYCITGWLFTHIFPFGEVALRLNIFSALFSALGAAYIALTVKTASGFLFPFLKHNHKNLYLPLIAGFSTAFSFSYWTQALIVEVYSMNAFFLALITYKIVSIIATENKIERDKLFVQTALISGIGFTNHLATLYPFLAGIITLIYLRYIPSWRVFLKGLALFILPLFLYLYLPIRSSMNPLMDWGDPETLKQFIWVLSGEQFKALVFSSLLLQTLFRIFTQINIIKQIGVTGLISSFIGIAYLLSIPGSKRLALFVFLTTVTFLNFAHIGNYLVIDPLSFMLPAFMMISTFASLGFGAIFMLTDIKLSRMRKSSPAVFFYRMCTVIFGIAIPLFMLVNNYKPADISWDTEGYDYATRAFENAVPGSAICETFYGRGLTLLYYYHAEGIGKDKNITPIYIEQLQFPWGKKNFRERHPELPITDNDYLHDDDLIAYDFIERNYDKLSGIYFGRMFTPPDGYDWEAADDLFKCFRIENSTQNQ